MIIDIRGILNKIEKDKENDNNYSLDMVYQDGSFVPKLSKGEPKITINPRDSIRELVGLTIVRPKPNKDLEILCNNGLFIKYAFVEAKDVLILPSFSDAQNFIKYLYCDDYVRHIMRDPNRPANDGYGYAIYAAYQEPGNNNLSFKFVYRP